MRWNPVIQIGEHVTVFSGEWLGSVLVAGESRKLPEEVRGDTRHLETLVGAGAGGEDGAVSNASELPEAVVRVDVGDVLRSQARDLAAETSELLVSLASLHGAPPSIWQLTGDCVSFVDGRPAGASFGTPRFFAASSEQELEMAEDNTASTLAEMASRLGSNLPMTRPQGRRAAQLLVWLRRARQTWEPGRLVLCDRVFEQVAGWAGIADRARFIRDDLRLAWALRQVRGEIAGSWTALVNANSALSTEHAIAGEAWRRVTADPDIGFKQLERGWHVNLKGVLLRLDWLLQTIESNSTVHERLSQLRDRAATGRATAQWVDELCSDFDVLEAAPSERATH